MAEDYCPRADIEVDDSHSPRGPHPRHEGDIWRGGVDRMLRLSQQGLCNCTVYSVVSKH